MADPGGGGGVRPGDGAAAAQAGRCAFIRGDGDTGGGGAHAMSVGFQAVQWNRTKLVYDAILIAGVALYIATYLTVVYWFDPPKDQPAAIDLRIRAFGTCAFLMLTIILS